MIRVEWFKALDASSFSSFPIHSVRAVEANNKRICLIRLAEGYYATEDTCPHAGGRLGYGRCDEEGYVVCPVHRYRYDPKTGRGKQGDYVKTFPLEEREDGIYLGFRKKRWWF